MQLLIVILYHLLPIRYLSKNMFQTIMVNQKIRDGSLIFVLIILLRLPFIFWPLISDEGGYAYTAAWWFQGKTLYSGSLWFDRPQGIFLVYKIGMLLLGTSPQSIRFWGSLWAAGTGIFVYFIGYKLENRQIGLLSGIVYSIFSTLPQIEGFTSNAEVFSLLPSTISALLVLDKKPGWAGLFASISFILKPSGISASIFIIFCLFYFRYPLKSWLYFVLSSIPLPFACFLHGLLTVGLNQYIYAVAGFRIELISNAPLQRFINGWKSTQLCWIPLSSLTVYGLWNQMNRRYLLPIIWIVTSLLGMSLSGHWNAHYFIQIVPPLALTSAIGIVKALKSKVVLLKILTLIIALPSIASIILLSIIDPNIGSKIIFNRIDYIIGEDVSAYIQRNTSINDEIYVSLASANISYLSERFSSSPNIFWSFLVFREGEFRRLITSINQGKPKYILLLEYPPSDIDKNGEFLDALNSNYYIETYFESVPLYRRNLK